MRGLRIFVTQAFRAKAIRKFDCLIHAMREFSVQILVLVIYVVQILVRIIRKVRKHHRNPGFLDHLANQSRTSGINQRYMFEIQDQHTFITDMFQNVIHRRRNPEKQGTIDIHTMHAILRRVTPSNRFEISEILISVFSSNLCTKSNIAVITPISTATVISTTTVKMKVTRNTNESLFDALKIYVHWRKPIIFQAIVNSIPARHASGINFI